MEWPHVPFPRNSVILRRCHLWAALRPAWFTEGCVPPSQSPVPSQNTIINREAGGFKKKKSAMIIMRKN